MNEKQNETNKIAPDVYLGIDLGTTNCSVSMGSKHNDKFDVEVISIDMLESDDSWRSKDVLPSFTYFAEGNAHPQVGPKAKEMLLTQPNRVVRSVKTIMGLTLTEKQWKSLKYDGIQYTPEEISSFYIKAILQGIKKKYEFKIEDAVITVPASFDTDMRSATIRAAELAGIKTKDNNGKPRNILIDEPRASLYDFINQIESGVAYKQKINFNEPQTVLVFDLGGGTLDVSLHKVQYKPDIEFIDIEDIAISRYTKLGGDVFDERLADFFYKDCIKSKKIDENLYEEHEIDGAKAKLFAFAEKFKVEITNKIIKQREYNPDISIKDFKHAVTPGYLFEMKSYTKELTMVQYEDIIRPLLGYDRQYPTLTDLENYNPTDDIISPIIDVLKKGYMANKILYKPTVVLLTGGMTKLHLVQERLESFFGFKPSALMEPGKSVSRGACVYHYYLHNGYKPSTITAESILFEDRSGLKPLVEAGVVITELQPYKRVFDRWTLSSDNTKKYGLRLYRSDIQHPILKRTYELTTNYPKGTPVFVEVTVDNLKIMSMRIWITGPNNEKKEEAKISIDTGDFRVTREENVKYSNTDGKTSVVSTQTIGNHTNQKENVTFPKELILAQFDIHPKRIEKIFENLNCGKNENLKAMVLKTIDDLLESKLLKKISNGYIRDDYDEKPLSLPISTGSTPPHTSSNPVSVKKLPKNIDQNLILPEIPLQKVKDWIRDLTLGQKIFSEPFTEKNILYAKNNGSLLNYLLKSVKAKTIKDINHKNAIYRILGKAGVQKRIRDNNPDLIDEIFTEFLSFMKYIIEDNRTNKKVIDNGLRVVVEGMGRIAKSNKTLFDSLFFFLDNPSYEILRSTIYITLGKLAPKIEIMDRFASDFPNILTRKGDVIALLWAFGKQSTRNINHPLILQNFMWLIDEMIKNFKDEIDYEKIIYYCFGLNDICDRKKDDANLYLNQEKINYVYAILEQKYEMLMRLKTRYMQEEQNHLKDLRRIGPCLRWIELFMKICKGSELSPEDQEFLLEWREKEEFFDEKE